MNSLLNPYQKNNKKTIRTNIDGAFSGKFDNFAQLEKGAIVEVKGSPELYKVTEAHKVIPNTPAFKFALERDYDEIADMSMVKCVNLNDLTLSARKELAENMGETFNENKYKENYIIFGVGFQFDGRLSKNQTVRMGNHVVTITDLVKPSEKGQPIEVIGKEVKRVMMESVHRVYFKENDEVTFLAEYEDLRDALVFHSRLHLNSSINAFM